MADEEQPLTLTQKELAEFIGALRTELVSAITENNSQAMQALFQNVLPPIVERMEMVASAQITLAAALRTSRRDAFALEFAKLFIERAMRTEQAIDQAAIHVIPAEAYALALEMDLHGRVAEVQAAAKDVILDEAASKARPMTDPKTLVGEFFGRKPAPVEPPKIKRPGGGKKH